LPDYPSIESCENKHVTNSINFTAIHADKGTISVQLSTSMDSAVIGMCDHLFGSCSHWPFNSDYICLISVFVQIWLAFTKVQTFSEWSLTTSTTFQLVTVHYLVFTAGQIFLFSMAGLNVNKLRPFLIFLYPPWGKCWHAVISASLV